MPDYSFTSAQGAEGKTTYYIQLRPRGALVLSPWQGRKGKQQAPMSVLAFFDLPDALQPSQTPNKSKSQTLPQIRHLWTIYRDTRATP